MGNPQRCSKRKSNESSTPPSSPSTLKKVSRGGQRRKNNNNNNTSSTKQPTTTNVATDRSNNNQHNNDVSSVKRRIRKPTNHFNPTDFDDEKKKFGQKLEASSSKIKEQPQPQLEKQIYETPQQKETLLQVGDIVYAEYHGNRKSF